MAANKIAPMLGNAKGMLIEPPEQQNQNKKNIQLKGGQKKQEKTQGRAKGVRIHQPQAQ